TTTTNLYEKSQQHQIESDFFSKTLNNNNNHLKNLKFKSTAMNGEHHESNLTRTLSTQSGLSSSDAHELELTLASLTTPAPSTAPPTMSNQHDTLTRSLSTESGLSQSDASDLCSSLEELVDEEPRPQNEAEKRRKMKGEMRRRRCVDGLVMEAGMSRKGAEEMVGGWEEVFMF
ncbi:hypothetical protein EX30DRAFT_342768, partial [Ascodesmis nigricans]